MTSDRLLSPKRCGGRQRNAGQEELHAGRPAVCAASLPVQGPTCSSSQAQTRGRSRPALPRGRGPEQGLSFRR